MFVLIPQAAAPTFASSNLLAVRLLLENSGVCSLQVWNHVIFIILHFLRAEQVISWRYSDSVLHGFLLTSTILGLSITIEKPIHCLCLSVSVLMLAAWKWSGKVLALLFEWSLPSSSWKWWPRCNMNTAPSNFSRAFSFANFTFTWQRNRTQAHTDIEVQHGPWGIL